MTMVQPRCGGSLAIKSTVTSRMTSNDGLEPARAPVRTAERTAFSGPATASALTVTVEPERGYGARPVALPGSVALTMKTSQLLPF
jgi:hypothetical protein